MLNNLFPEGLRECACFFFFFFFSEDDIVVKRNWERVFSTNSFDVTFDAVPSWFEGLKIVAEAVRCCLFIVRRTCTLMPPTPTLYFYSRFF